MTTMDFHLHDTKLVIEERLGNAVQWFMIQGRDCEISLEARPAYCDRGAWVAKIFVNNPRALHIDDSDGWPRYYFDFDRALAEIEAWLRARQQMPEPVSA